MQQHRSAQPRTDRVAVVVNTAARQDAVGAMVQQAQEAGADAVVGVRFDNGKVSETVSELTAYGTAVRLRSVEGDQI